MITSGFPFKDHWGYWVYGQNEDSCGVLIHATGNVRDGFTLQIKRSFDFSKSTKKPTMIPLQWIDSQFVDQKAMFNNGEYKDDKAPVYKFEASAFKVEAPGKSLNATDDLVSFCFSSFTVVGLNAN